jgi:hypothetical protein
VTSGTGRSATEVAALAGGVLLAGLAWSSPLGAPLRILVVLFHELGHAGAALVTGGEVLEIAVRLDESGHALTRGGWELVVLNAGYLGAQGIGLALVQVGRRLPLGGGGLLAGLFAVGAWWSGVSLAGVACVAACGLAGWATLRAARSTDASVPGWRARALGWGVQGVGVLAVVHAVLDAASDFGAGDAALLASRTWVPGFAWSALWVLSGSALTVAWARAELVSALRSAGTPSGP